MDFPLLNELGREHSVLKKHCLMLKIVWVYKSDLNDDVAFGDYLHLVIECLPHHFLTHVLKAAHLVALAVHSVLSIKLKSMVRFIFRSLGSDIFEFRLDFLTLSEQVDITAGLVTLTFSIRQQGGISVGDGHCRHKTWFVDERQQVNAHPSVSSSIDIEAELDRIEVDDFAVWLTH